MHPSSSRDRHGDRRDRSVRFKAEVDSIDEGRSRRVHESGHDMRQRQKGNLSRYHDTFARVHASTPCSGATYIIATLIVFWFIGVVFGAVKFTAANRDVPDVKNVDDLSSAMTLIGQNSKALSWLVLLGLFVGALAFCFVYLA
jgi:hypothetical protein